MAKPNQRTDSEEEALFRSYPYGLYFVQSPSTISHTNTNFNEEASRQLVLSRYSSSHGSNKLSLDQAQLEGPENGEKGNAAIIKARVLHDVGDHYDDDDDDDDQFDFHYEIDHKGWIKYFSFSYSNSGWWIFMQLCWRFLLSFLIALLVFYLAAKPPAPKFSIKIAGVREFRLGEGVDASGVTTKILSCNCSINLTVDNNSRLFALHIHPPVMQIFFGHLPFAISKSKEVNAGSDDLTLLRLNVGTSNKAMYGAGRNMQDLLESGKGLPLVIKVSLRSSFDVVWRIIQPKFHHEAQCFVVLKNQYDKKHRTLVYNSTCFINNS